MINQAEVHELARELAEEHLAKLEAARDAEAAKYAAVGLGACPHCKSHRAKNTNVKNVFECKDCNSLFGKEYRFVFPAWARGKNRDMRRAICLMFGIMEKENAHA